MKKWWRKFRNPLDEALKQGGRRVLIGWNRGMGDLALGLYAVIHRVREKIPDAEITFVTRSGLVDAFQLLEGVNVIEETSWKRGQVPDLSGYRGYDIVIDQPSPTDWCRWQLGKLTPRLKWRKEWSGLWRRLGIPEGTNCIGVQVSAETDYGTWRNWPAERWRELFARLGERPDTRIILLGLGKEEPFVGERILDLRGKTTLFELVSLIRERLSCVIAPDSGVLSLAYYLDAEFPLRVVSLWAGLHHGILKQGVPSPNPLLEHRPVFAPERELGRVSAAEVLQAIDGPLRPIVSCATAGVESEGNVGVLILAGGEGTRLGHTGPKGTFEVAGKALFDHLLERVGTAPVAVMTSPKNHAETVAFVRGRAQCFQQPVSAEGPIGNGCVFAAFVASGIANEWKRRGIDVVSVVLVDNPLADPLGKQLVGFLRARKLDVAVGCIEREGRPMGVLVEREGKLAIVEYMKWTGEARYGSTGSMAMTMAWLEKVAPLPLPWHWVKKREQFIFDAFRWADRIEPLCFPREVCYAPIKGRDSVPEVEALIRR